MFIFWFCVIIGILVLIDWSTYKMFPGDKKRNGEILVNDNFTIYTGVHHLGFHFEPEYDDGEHMMLIASTMFHQFFYYIPSWKVPEGVDRWNDESYRFGFYLYDDNPKKLFTTMNLYWRSWNKTLWMPWNYELHHLILEGQDGARYIEFYGDNRKRNKRAEKYNCKPIPVKDTYDIYHNPKFYWQEPYEYVLKSGNVQRCIGMYHIEEREWRPRGTKFIPIFKLTHRDLEINLTDEIGERAGSWKGGTMGFGRRMLPGETPQEAYHRIMKETKFD